MEGQRETVDNPDHLEEVVKLGHLDSLDNLVSKEDRYIRMYTLAMR